MRSICLTHLVVGFGENTVCLLPQPRHEHNARKVSPHRGTRRNLSVACVSQVQQPLAIGRTTSGHGECVQYSAKPGRKVGLTVLWDSPTKRLCCRNELAK
jgi:hypothetical protein